MNISLLVVELVFLTLISRVALQFTASSFDPPYVLSGWTIGATLTVRIDGLSLAYLFIPVLLLLAIFLAQTASEPTLLLGLAGGAAAVFTAANGLALDYALFLFDSLGCLYWFTRRQPTLAISRLSLAILTTTALTLEGLSIFASSGLFLTFMLWLRISLIPFIELSILSTEEAKQTPLMIWLSFSTSIGLYIAARFLVIPLSLPLSGGLILIICLNAWLAWSSDSVNVRYRLLRLILTQSSLALFMIPLSVQIAVTMGLGCTLALGALWLTPQLGRPNFLERHWLWIYTAPILATLSLVGFPYTFGRVYHSQIYAYLLQNGDIIKLILIIFAEGIALSILYQYWTQLLSLSAKTNERNLWAALILTIPFLIPGVASVMFEAITGVSVNLDEATNIVFNATNALWTTLMLGLVWVLAILLGQEHHHIWPFVDRARQTQLTTESLSHLWHSIQSVAKALAHFILRLKLILEGPHYLGWVLLIGLAGFLVMVLD